MKRIIALASVLAVTAKPKDDDAAGQVVDAVKQIINKKASALDLSPTGDGLEVSKAQADKLKKALTGAGFKPNKVSEPTVWSLTKGDTTIFVFDYEDGEGTLGVQFGDD